MACGNRFTHYIGKFRKDSALPSGLHFRPLGSTLIFLKPLYCPQTTYILQTGLSVCLKNNHTSGETIPFMQISQKTQVSRKPQALTNTSPSINTKTGTQNNWRNYYVCNRYRSIYQEKSFIISTLLESFLSYYK